MDIYAAILDEMVSMAQAATSLNVFKGPMPAEESVALDIANGGTETVQFSRDTLESVNLVINGKSGDMATVRQALGQIHAALTRAASYPNDARHQIYAVVTTRSPSYAGREPNDQWLFVSAVTVRFYYK